MASAAQDGSIEVHRGVAVRLARVPWRACCAGAVVALCCLMSTLTAAVQNPLYRFLPADLVMSILGLFLVYHLRSLRPLLWLSYWIAFPALAIGMIWSYRFAQHGWSLPPVANARMLGYVAAVAAWILALQFASGLRNFVWQTAGRHADLVLAAGFGVIFGTLQHAFERGELATTLLCFGREVSFATAGIALLAATACGRLPRRSTGAAAGLTGAWGALSWLGLPGSPLLAACLGAIFAEAAFAGRRSRLAAAYSLHLFWAVAAITSALYALLGLRFPELVAETLP